MRLRGGHEGGYACWGAPWGEGAGRPACLSILMQHVGEGVGLAKRAPLFLNAPAKSTGTTPRGTSDIPIIWDRQTLVVRDMWPPKGP